MSLTVISMWSMIGSIYLRRLSRRSFIPRISVALFAVPMGGVVVFPSLVGAALLMKRKPETPQVRTPSPFRSKALHLPQFSSTASRPDGSVKPVMRISLKHTNEIGETEVMRITDREKPSQIKGIFLAGIALSLNIVSLAGQTNPYEA